MLSGVGPKQHLQSLGVMMYLVKTFWEWVKELWTFIVTSRNPRSFMSEKYEISIQDVAGTLLS